MTNLIPEKWRARLGLALTIVVAVLAVMAEWQDMGATWVRWTGRAFALLVVLSNVLGLSVSVPRAKLPPGGTAGVISILAIIAALTLPACSNSLATSYRAYGVLVTARDGAGETIAVTQRAAMVRCEAEHKPPAEGWQTALKGCYADVRAPVAVWVRHVKPAITAALSAYWLALEAAYIAGHKELNKAGKAAAGACSALKSAESALTQYADRLGTIGATVLGAVAAGKVLVCR